MEVVVNSTHVTVPSVFFCSATLRTSALGPNVSDVSTVVTSLCKEIKTFVITVAVKTT